MVNIYDCIFKWTHIKSSLQICGSVGDLHRVSDIIVSTLIVYLEKVRFIEIYLKRCSQKTCPERQLIFNDVIFKTYRCDISSM